MFITFHAIIFKIRTPWVYNCQYTETEFYMKFPLTVILGHSFCNQLQADKG